MDEQPIDISELTPIPSVANDTRSGADKLNELLAVMSLLAFLWNFFSGGNR